MKNMIKKLLLAALMVFILLPFTAHKDVRAEGVYINYIFSGFAIPEGQSDVFYVDENTINILRADPSLASIFVAALAEKYNTSFAVLDQNTELNYLNGVISGALPGGDHIPTYMPVAAPSEPVTEASPSAGENQTFSTPVNMDINAGNYIDINITTQTLTLYQNGAGVYATPVVTGNVSRGHRTPEGLFAVQYKQLNRTLKGEDYESFVHYWMRIVNNVGIHDASWRSSFGGQIYKTSGSHGCINVPPSLMPALYAAVPEGTPVWVHS